MCPARLFMTDSQSIDKNALGLENCQDPEGYLPPLESDPRPSWDQYFMEIAELVSSRSTCLSRQVGAVIVRDRRILCTGFNGPPARIAHCIDLGCLRRGLGIPHGERMELCRGCCAEENAILQAARIGIPLEDAHIYSTLQPCLKCARMIINVGLKRVIFAGEYPQPMAREFLQAANIEMMLFDSKTGTLTQADNVERRYLDRHAHRNIRAGEINIVEKSGGQKK